MGVPTLGRAFAAVWFNGDMSNTPNPWQPVEPDRWATRPRSELPVDDVDADDPTRVMKAVQSSTTSATSPPPPQPWVSAPSDSPLAQPFQQGYAPAGPTSHEAAPAASPARDPYAPDPAASASASAPAASAPASAPAASSYGSGVPSAASVNPYAMPYPGQGGDAGQPHGAPAVPPPAPGVAGYPSYGASAPEVYPTAQSGYQAGGSAGGYPPHAQPGGFQGGYPQPAQPGYPPAAYVPTPASTPRLNVLKSLFDFSFGSYATPKLVKIVYVLAVVGAAGGWLTSLMYAASLDAIFRSGYLVAVTFLFGWIPALLGLALTRAVLEGVLAIIRTSEHTAEIAEALKSRDSDTALTEDPD